MICDDDLFIEVLLVFFDFGFYSFINQGVFIVDGIDDVEEMKMIDVCCIKWGIIQLINFFIDFFFFLVEYFFFYLIFFDEIYY